MANGRSFSPAKALGIPSKSYDDFWGSGTFNPDKGYSSTGLMPTSINAFDEQFAQNQATEDLAALDDRRAMFEQPESFMGEEGEGRRLSSVLRGTLSPSQDYALARAAKPPAINKYSEVPSEVVRAASKLQYIDPTEPDAFQKRNTILQELDDDPEFGGSNIKAHPYLREVDQGLVHNIFASRGGAGRSAEDERSKRLSALESKQLDLAAQEIGQISGTAKVAAFRAAHGREPVTAEDWKIAYGLADQGLAPQREMLAQIVRDLEESGRAVPGRYKQMSGLAENGVFHDQKSNVPQPQDLPVVKTKQEYDAMPVGARGIDGLGRPFTKKARNASPV